MTCAETPPLAFDLRAARLGDVLLAMPAMRAGDVVITRHRVPGLQVSWRSDGEGLTPQYAPGRHATECWLKAARRPPIRHEIRPEVGRDLLVIAPVVQDPLRQWRGWGALREMLPDGVWLSDREPRDEWIEALARAHTVICPDTGTLHMADALGCRRIVGLFGANMDRYAPYWCGPKYCIERVGMLITPDEVVEMACG